MEYIFYGNVHTAMFYIESNSHINQEIMESNAKSMKMKGSEKGSITAGDIIINLGLYEPYIEVFIDFIELLKKNSINEKDILEINTLLENNLSTVYSFQTRPTLKRVDLRVDIAMETSIRRIYLQQVSKALDKRRNLQKRVYEDETVYYRSESKYESVRINIYDKVKEREKKRKTVTEFDENIIRLEVQLMNRHLNYMERQYGIKKDISNYLTDDRLKDYIQRYLMPVLFSGNYLKRSAAYSIINKSNLSNYYKNELKTFLRRVIKKGLYETKSVYKPNKWRNLIGLLHGLKINPILLPDECPVERLDNPLIEFLENC